MTTIERHLTDDELLLVLDGDAPAADGPVADRPDTHHPADPEPAGFNASAHAASCERCSAALASLRADSELLTDWLERAAFEAAAVPDAVDPTQPGQARPGQARPGSTRSSSTPGDLDLRSPDPRGLSRRVGWAASPRWLQAAAVLLFVAAPLAAFPGVRAWVVERIAPTATLESVAPTAGDPADAVVLRFRPTAGHFEIRFPEATTGLLALERWTGDDAELRARGGTPETVVTASSLEIRNDASGRYDVRLPGSVTGVRVRVGDRVVAVSAAQIGRGTVIELGR
jgi:hypothetical protein